MQTWEKRFVNSQRHSSRVASQAERRLRPIHPRPGQRLLDVGCGNGAAAIHLATTLGLDVVGVDIDPDQISNATLAAATTPGVRFLVADATNLPFSGDEFDLVYTNKTTHHIADWQQAITEMVRVLKPGGHLVYTDFVAPFGHRFPTRAGINLLAAELALHHMQQRKSPFRYTIILRTPSGAASQNTMAADDAGTTLV